MKHPAAFAQVEAYLIKSCFWWNIFQESAKTSGRKQIDLAYGVRIVYEHVTDERMFLVKSQNMFSCNVYKIEFKLENIYKYFTNNE